MRRRADCLSILMIVLPSSINCNKKNLLELLILRVGLMKFAQVIKNERAIMAKIYVIEDDERIRELLKDYGYQVMAYEIAEPTFEEKKEKNSDMAIRIRSQLRRSDKINTEAIISNSYIKINLTTREVMYENIPIELTFKEFELLTYLIENSSRVVPRDELLYKIWGCEYNPKSRTLDIHIRTLRQKLGTVGTDCIKTVRSVGYRFVKKSRRKQEAKH